MRLSINAYVSVELPLRMETCEVKGFTIDLSGKNAIVTGASRGLGQAIAIGLAEAGAKVGITSRSLKALEETQSKITDFGGKFRQIELDVRDITAMSSILQTVAHQVGEIDILVNNAGYEQVCPSHEVTEEIWDTIMETNLKGAFFAAQTAASSMVRSGRGGAIVNVCSLTSYIGVPTAVPYGSSKSGLLGMTRALSTEWASEQIRVNAIAPGYFRTELTEAFYREQAWQEAMLQKIPLNSFGNANDLKGAVIFLVSDAAKYITGQCLAIDGGYLASV